jgi:holo-[acyl-carrier protein] synthase
MIIGIGIDLTDIRRIEALRARFGPRFTARLFTEEETRYAESRKDAKARAGIYAKRFAAKEAAAKALGCGIGAKAGWREIEIVRNVAGGPGLRFTGAALVTLQSLAEPSFTIKAHLSMTDEYPFAQAMVVLNMQKLSDC